MRGVTNNIGVPTYSTNGALIHIGAGGLEFTAHLTNDGAITVDTNANLVFQAGGTTFDLGAASDLSGDGTVSANFGTLNVAGGLDLYQLTVNGGTANLNGTNDMFVSVVNFTNGTLGGTNYLEVGDQFTWAGGAIAGSNVVISDQTLNILGQSLNLSGRTLLNSSNAVWTNNIFTGPAQITFSSRAIFSNAPGSSFLIVGDGNGSWSEDGGNFCQCANGGTFLKTGNGYFTSSIFFNNSSNVGVLSGGLTLNGGGTNSGIYDVHPGAQFILTGGAFLFTTNSLLNVITNGIFNINGISVAAEA